MSKIGFLRDSKKSIIRNEISLLGRVRLCRCLEHTQSFKGMYRKEVFSFVMLFYIVTPSDLHVDRRRLNKIVD